MADTKQQLQEFDKSLIIDELHNILSDVELRTLINNLQQSSASNGNQPNDLTGQELDDQLDDYMDRLNIRQKSRAMIFQAPEPQKRDMIQKYEQQLGNQAAPPSDTPPPNVGPKLTKKDRKNTWVEPAKKDILIQGFLLKKGAGMANKYRKRWFVLYHNNSIAYYDNPENAKTQKNDPLGEISLYHVTSLNKKANMNDKKGPKYKFELVTQGRTFSIKAEDANTYHAWIRRITQRVTPTVIYKGWAVKRGNKNTHSWTKRFFSLVNYEQVNSELRYYETDKMKKFKGLIDVSEIKEVAVLETAEAKKKYGKSKQWVLELHTPDRTYVLSYKKLDSLSRWEDELKRVKFDDDITKQTSIFTANTPASALQEIAETKSRSVTTDDEKKQTHDVGLGDRLSANPLSASASASTSGYDDAYAPQVSAQTSANSHEQTMDQDDYYEEDEAIDRLDTEDGFADLDITGDDDNANDPGAGLPAGWIVLYTDDGHPYYWEESSNTTTWTKPFHQ